MHKGSPVVFKPTTWVREPQAVRADRFQVCTHFLDKPRLAGCSRGGAQAIVENSLMRRESSVEKPMRLALIGMSGAGKTFWAKKLAGKGAPAVFCDERIEQRLGPRLGPGGYSEAEYLAEEVSTLHEVLLELEEKPDASLVLDTTGSVIYAGNHLLMRLRRQMTIVYLAATAKERQLLIERYLNDPKPVLWRGAFQPKGGETPRETVARCYPALMEARRRSYEALAHCTLGVAELRATLDAKQFLDQVRRQMK